MAEMTLLYPLSDFFPRKNHHNQSSVDEGHFEKNPCPSDSCKGPVFETESIEYCPTCGYFVDYWAKEDQEKNKKYLTSCGRTHLEQWYLLKKIEKLLQDQKCDPENYSLSFFLKKDCVE